MGKGATDIPAMPPSKGGDFSKEMSRSDYLRTIFPWLTAEEFMRRLYASWGKNLTFFWNVPITFEIRGVTTPHVQESPA
jgi:hypothetical protein